MILYDEDYANIYRQMSEEKIKVEYWKTKNTKKILKQFKRSPTVPVFYHEIRTMPDTNNKYLLWYYASTRNECEKETCYAGAVLLLDDKDGKRIAICLKTLSEMNHPDWNIDSLQIFSGHFFSRYKQRYPSLKDTDPIGLMVQFFGRNGGYMYEVDYNEFTLEKSRKPHGSAWGMDDGVTFASKKWIDIGSTKIFVTKHHTFLSRKELKPNQLAVLPSQSEVRAKLIHHYNH